MENHITVINTAIKEDEDLDLLCNSLNALAGRLQRIDNSNAYFFILRAQAAIDALRDMLDKEN